MNELVSVVIPVYNMENSICECLRSILAQDYPNIEIILVDDGSGDNSLEVCKKLALSDSRIKVFHTENRGSGPARNTGIDNSSGRYAYFPDADDYVAPNAISVLVKAMEEGKHDLVVFGFKNVNSKGHITSEKIYREATFDAEKLRQDYSECIGYTSKWGIQGAPWNKFFDMRVIRENKIEYPPLRRHQDEGFIARYMCYAKSVHFISDLLYTYYTNDLKKEWQKYPVDYIDAVIGLNEIRMQTIYKWNGNDTKTHDLLANEYVCNVIKALELSFSPKMKFSAHERKKWIEQNIVKAKLKIYNVTDTLGTYQKFVMKLVKKSKLSSLYLILKIKVFAEKCGLLRYRRKR